MMGEKVSPAAGWQGLLTHPHPAAYQLASKASPSILRTRKGKGGSRRG